MTQEQAFTILKTGANVFLTGEPGAGKTHVVNRYTEYLASHNIDVAITASTGIAATHIGGMTIHSWSGIGVRDSLDPYDLDQIASRERVVKRIETVKVLIIDEVSMLDGRVLDMVDKVCRVIRRKGEPFGGLQVVLVGDFFQLPPIGARGVATRFAFESRAWEALAPLACYLTEQYRQDDTTLLSVLGALRKGEVDDIHLDILTECKDTVFPDHIEPTRLYTHNADVDRINTERLKALPGEKRLFAMTSKGSATTVEGLKKSCLSPENLELRIGAMVMCTKNNFDVGFANGTLGKVAGYDRDTGNPVIETVEKERMVVAPMEWRIEEDGKVRAEIRQVPLRLAWAITVHKSQGMSLDAADIDLSSAFEYGQGYVALSRVRTLKGLLLRGCNAQALRVHPKILEVDDDFRAQSDDVAETFEQLPQDELATLHRQFIIAQGGTLEPIRTKKGGIKEKESTYQKTRELIRAGKTVADIAALRDIKEGTVIDHLEKLIADGSIAADDCAHLKFGKDEKVKTAELHDAFTELGVEKLKPIFEYAGGRYSYEDIRLARFLFTHDLLS